MNFITTQAKIMNILAAEKATAEDVAEIMKSAGVTAPVEFSSPENDAAIEKLLTATYAHKDWKKHDLSAFERNPYCTLSEAEGRE